MQNTIPHKIIPADTGKLLLLVIVSIFFNYTIPIDFVKDVWFLFIMYLYVKSKDEVFWLAVMLILNDGFLGFFGIRGIQITSFRIPDFELGHLYIILAFLKINKTRAEISIFYHTWLIILFIFILFLILLGFSLGIPSDYSIFLRTLRVVFPFFLIYLVPKLLTTNYDYERFFFHLYS